MEAILPATAGSFSSIHIRGDGTMEYPPSGMASFLASPVAHRLTHWFVGVLLIFFGLEALHGLDQLYADQNLGGTSAAGLVWLKTVGLQQVRGILLAVAAVLLAVLAGGLQQDAAGSWTRWWIGFPALLMAGISWTLWGAFANSHWMPSLSIALSLLLFLVAVGLSICTGESRRCFGVVKEDFQRPGVFAVGVLSTVFLFAHVVIEVGPRYTLFGSIPHQVSLVVGAPLVICLVAMVLRRHAEVHSLTRPAVLLACLLPVNMALGNWCYMLGMRQPADAWLQIHRNTVVAGELHLLGGAVLGALSLVVTLRARTQLSARVIASPLKRGAVEA